VQTGCDGKIPIGTILWQNYDRRTGRNPRRAITVLLRHRINNNNCNNDNNYCYCYYCHWSCRYNIIIAVVCTVPSPEIAVAGQTRGRHLIRKRILSTRGRIMHIVHIFYTSNIPNIIILHPFANKARILRRNAFREIARYNMHSNNIIIIIWCAFSRPSNISVIILSCVRSCVLCCLRGSSRRI